MMNMTPRTLAIVVVAGILALLVIGQVVVDVSHVGADPVLADIIRTVVSLFAIAVSTKIASHDTAITKLQNGVKHVDPTADVGEPPK